MKRWQKILLWTVGTLVVLIGGLLIYMVTYKPDQRPLTDLTIEATPERLARGRYLVEHALGCLGCHSKRDWSRFGGPVDGTPGAGGDCLGEDSHMPGTVCFPNITPHAGGLKDWSDDAILRAIREGVDKDGEAIFPMMPYRDYRNLSDEDAYAVVAYLKTLAPGDNAPGESDIDFPVSFFIKLVPEPITSPVEGPDPSDEVAWGRYLVTVGGCRSCHTPVDDKHRPLEGREFAGGQEFVGAWGKVRSANISPSEAGIKSWTRERFIQRFKGYAGVTPGETSTNTVMPWLENSGMTDKDLGAIWAYLQTVEPQHQEVTPWD